ncbi:uncharacterized protein EV422DRAFT_356618 [Fimicolochytrium jonesii]|uniref:uncharacterized protein n=1 Tax=Fimicolochytrium jonesii TaxID=1396493 RepID=UPI0022FE98B8|nr:uncharacterized protein EV422DRAFT_356618 [Fimicolochytrium jonesii]KAI8823469.1 hypothetical protein EV422DRAFT_356618 [Fimicolochytrium jonesii]
MRAHKDTLVCRLCLRRRMLINISFCLFGSLAASIERRYVLSLGPILPAYPFQLAGDEAISDASGVVLQGSLLISSLPADHGSFTSQVCTLSRCAVARASISLSSRDDGMTRKVSPLSPNSHSR